jgi:hypothetical protein
MVAGNKLAVLCFEQIKDNYWYAQYGPFRLVMMKDSGHINATKMCKDAGKVFYQWARQKHVKKFIRYVGVRVKKENGGVLPKPMRVSIKAADDVISGVYIHPDLIASLAGWVSIEYGLNVISQVVHNHFHPNITLN